MKKEWCRRLQLGYASMTDKEKQAANYLLDHPECPGSRTLRFCAAGGNVGQQTLVRMLSKCGYKTWQDFKQAVWQEECKGKVSSIEERVPAHISDIPGQAAEEGMEALADFVKNLDLQCFRETVRAIKKARIVDIYGVEGSAGPATELAGMLLHLGISCRMYSDMFFQKISAEHTGAKDVAIGISQSGQTRLTVGALRLAKESGAMTIAVTGQEDAEITRYADYCFFTPCKKEENAWLTSRLVQTAFGGMLYRALLASDPQKYQEKLKRTGKDFEEDVI